MGTLWGSYWTYMIPALLLSSGYGTVLLVVAVLGWFAGLFTGRMPSGIRDLGAAGIRYNAQATAYLLLVTDRYPYSAPFLRDDRSVGAGSLRPEEIDPAAGAAA